INLLEKEKPTVLGLTVYSDTLPASLFAFKLTKEKYPHIKTYMGGGVFADQLAPGSPNWDKLLEETKGYIDKIIIGEGEKTFLKALKGELPESQRVYTMEDINWEILDLKTVDILDLTDFDVADYQYNLSYTSRSCPFQCSFCSETIQWGKYRKKAGKQVMEEVLQLYKTHDFQLFLLSDSLLNPVIEDISSEFSRSDTVLYWEGWLRVDKKTVNLENTFKWRRSGLYHARLGIESGSQHVLDMMNKKTTVEESKSSIANLAAAGIKTTTLWVVGHPGETEEDFQKTLDFIEEMREDLYEAECRPFYYYLAGQAGTVEDTWFKMKTALLYPERFTGMLKYRTWLLDGEPTREETYRRVNRFVQHCKKLGIPNPYSSREIYEADERWK
ncbi:MAG: radical SAM protein, partial [bacterium]|nr:radical SAM protein [bacterium]